MDARTLKDGLHIHFSRSKHGGGEVDRCEWLSDSGTVVLSFLNNNREFVHLNVEHCR